MRKEGSFKNTDGNVFDLRLSIGKTAELSRVDFSEFTKADVDFLVMNEELFEELSGNRPFLGAVCYVVCREQFVYYLEEELKQEGVSALRKRRIEKAIQDEEACQLLFLDMLDNEVFTEMRKAFFEALANFTPGTGTVLSRVLGVQEKNEKKLRDEIEQRLPKFLTAAEKEFRIGLQTYLEEMDKSLNDGEAEKTLKTSSSPSALKRKSALKKQKK